MKSRSCILFQNETEMSFWMGIYQTAMRSEPPVAVETQNMWEDSCKNTPEYAADKAVREFRKRMNPPSDRYHNSPHQD